MKRQPVRPMGRSVNDSIWKRVLRGAASVAMAFVIAAFLALIVIEWMAGCGETYIDSKGVRHANECIFLSYHK